VCPVKRDIVTAISNGNSFFRNYTAFPTATCNKEERSRITNGILALFRSKISRYEKALSELGTETYDTSHSLIKKINHCELFLIFYKSTGWV
jgi:hypothetical protein